MNRSRRSFLHHASCAAGANLFVELAASRGWALQTGAPPSVAASSGAPPDRTAQGRQAAAITPIKVIKLTDTISLLQGVGGNMVVQIGPDGKLLIDSSYATAADRIKAILGKLDAHPLRLLINTNWHPEETDGNAAMHDAGAFIVAHVNTRVRLATAQFIAFYKLHVSSYPTSALPQETFDEGETLYYNNDELSLVHIPAAQTDSNIYIFFKNGNVLHAGGVWFNGMYPFIDASSGGNINGMIQGADQLLAVADDKTRIVPGHGPLGNKAALAAYREMLATSATRVEKLKGAGQSLDRAVAAKPTADLDPIWAKGPIAPDAFVTFVYTTLP